MQSLASRVMPAVLRLRGSKQVYRSHDATVAHIAALQVRPGSWAPPLKLERHVRFSVRTFQGWPVYEIEARGRPTTGYAVYVHGGAWIHEISLLQWRLVAELAAATGVRFTVPIYPLAPIGTAAGVVPLVADLTAELMAAAGDDHLTLLGDSAGGTIALSAALELRDRELPAPRRTVLISPALDLSFTDPAMPAIAAIDPWLDIPGPRAAAELWRGDLAIDDPRVSPMHGDLRGLAPVTLFTGTRDVVNADAREFRRRATLAGLPLDYHEVPDMLHDYPLMPIPEGRAARRLIAELLRER